MLSTTYWSWLEGELSRSVSSRMFSARCCVRQPPSRLSRLVREGRDGRQGDTRTAFVSAVYCRRDGAGWICDLRDRRLGRNLRTVGRSHRTRRGRGGFEREEGSASDRWRGGGAACKGG